MLSLAKSPEVGFFFLSIFTLGKNPRLLFKDSRMKSRKFDPVELGELICMFSSPCPHTCTLLLLRSLPVDTFSRLADAAPQSACQKCNVKCSSPRVIGLDICACVLFANTHTSRCNPSVPLFGAWLCRHVVTYGFVCPTHVCTHTYTRFVTARSRNPRATTAPTWKNGRASCVHPQM